MKIILDFMLGICQFKKHIYSILFLTLLVSGCAKKEVIKPIIRPTGTWFSTHQKYRFVDIEDSPVSHLFFDFKPMVDIDRKLIDAVVITPENSRFHYDFDLVSGKRFYSHEYCKEKDVWKSYGPDLERPPYTEAIVPRLLDQIKKPQRVIIFGDSQYLSSGKFPQDETIRVKVIGGALEQFCDRFPCDNEKKWKSRLLLFAVSTLDPKFKNISSFGELVKILDWKEVKGFIENGRGRSISGGDSYPAFRLIGQVYPTKAIKYALGKGHLFSSNEITTLRKSCESVYERLFKLRDLVQSGEGSLPKEFHKFYLKYWDSFKTCRQYVRASNITYNEKDHWFMEYISAFGHAEDKGFVYQCQTKAWVRNYNSVDGKTLYNQATELKYCTEEGMNLAFERAVNLMTGLSTSGLSFHRYVEYDSGAKSLHNKIYNWLFVSGKKQSCTKSKTEDLVFPNDVSWTPIFNPEAKEKDVSVYIR